MIVLFYICYNNKFYICYNNTLIIILMIILFYICYDNTYYNLSCLSISFQLPVCVSEKRLDCPYPLIYVTKAMVNISSLMLYPLIHW